MTTPAVSTIKSGGSRFYLNPADDRKLPGVTSVLDMIPKHSFLKPWAAKMVAEFAVDNASDWIGLVMKGERVAAVDLLKRAPFRFTDNAADTGTGAHDLFERMAAGDVLSKSDVRPELLPYVRHFREFLDVWTPDFLFLERTVWSETHGYAGTFDAIFSVIMDGEKFTAMGDWKTTRSGVHEEVALQLTAYANADYILGADGEQTPIPKVDGGAVLHVRPEGWKLVPAAINDDTMRTFLALKEVWEWETNTKRMAIGRPIQRTKETPA